MGEGSVAPTPNSGGPDRPSLKLRLCLRDFELSLLSLKSSVSCCTKTHLFCRGPRRIVTVLLFEVPYKYICINIMITGMHLFFVQ